MQRYIRFSLGRLIERMAVLSAPRHRDLVRAMVSELDSISDPAERRRFALGALAAIARMALSRYSEMAVRAPSRIIGISVTENNPTRRDPSMPKTPPRQLLRRHVTPFLVTFTTLTALQLADLAAHWLPQLTARGVSAGTFLEVLLLGVPATIALTIPMAVFIAVLWVFSRLGEEGVLSAARGTSHGVRRLVSPVLCAAAVIAALAFVSNSQILPRTNGRLTTVLSGTPGRPTDRSMTIGELREAARSALKDAGPDAAARAVEYEVEIHKKFALAAACLFLALAGATIPLRFRRGGMGLVIGASGVVFTGYYVSLVAGESLADQQVISPIVAMWMANALLLALVLLLVRRPGGPEAQTTTA